VGLSSQGEGLVLTIRDDGRGIMEHEISSTTSLGIMGMNERADAFGGKVELRGSAGEGTTLSVRIPRAASPWKGPGLKR